MKTYTITQEQLDSREAMIYPGVSEPGEYTYSEADNLYVPIGTKPVKHQQTGSDFDRGFGIGGLGRYEETPAIPSIAAMKRVERMEVGLTYCRRCGQSEFDGVMFTTAPSSGYCDDCFG